MNLISEGLKGIIDVIYGISGDYGIAIVVITLLVRTALLPLNAKQRKSMKKQQELNKKMEEVKEKYKGKTAKKDQEKLNQEIQEIVAKEGVGAMGCLVSLLQLPIMICLYQAIRGSAVSNVSTALLPWITSLLTRDAMFILPILSIVTQLLPQVFPYLTFFQSLELPKSNSKVVLMLVCTTGMVSFLLPSGLVLYYTVSNIYVACEQFIVNYNNVRKKKKVALIGE